MLTAVARVCATMTFLIAMTLLLVVPAVFSVVPMSPEAEALTLCLPGIGPIQRFTDGLHGEREELAFIHEGVHAKQCHEMGAAAFARQVTSPSGRLAMEAQALCAEAEVLSLRGGDRSRLVAWTVEALASEYFSDDDLPREEIVAAVNGACGPALAE